MQPEDPSEASTKNLRTGDSIIDVEVVSLTEAQARSADVGNDPEEGPVSKGIRAATSPSALNILFFFNAPWDWRGVGGAVTSVKNQGACGSCYAFAVVGVTESMHMISRGSYFPNLSEQQIVDCSTENLGCGGGWITKAMKYIRDNGLVSESTYPYTGVKAACKYNSGSWKVSSYTTHLGCAALRTAVRKGPIAVGLAASSWGSYASGVFTCPSTGNVNHAVLLVGYTSAQHWIIKNSWGTTWGMSGYMTIDQDANCKICTYSAVSAIVN